MNSNLPSLLRQALAHPLSQTALPWGVRSEGKVRDSYRVAASRVLVTTDRLSAFDRSIGTLPVRGQVLNQISAWWFERTRDIVDNHVLSVPDPSVTVAHECEPLLVEMVVRGYLTGSTDTSIWVHYERGERSYCGHRLPDGLAEHAALPEPLLTPSTKAPRGQHDTSVSREHILQTTKIASRDFDEMSRLSLALFRRGQELCAARGLILVDTKYEFGKTPDGRLILIDEVHTPDCSRFWDAADYAQCLRTGAAPENLDKEFVRRHLKSSGYRASDPTPTLSDDIRVGASLRYIEVAERLMERELTLSFEPPLPRITRNLTDYFQNSATSGAAAC